MKRGPFAPAGLCCPAHHHYYGPLRLPLDRPPFPGITGYRPGIASRRPADRRGREGSPQFPGRPSARSTPITPGGSSASAPGSQTPSLAFAVVEPARHPLFPRSRAGPLTTLAQASLALRTGRSLGPASHPASQPRTGAPLPRTRASPRTGLTPAGRPELIARLRHAISFSSRRPSSLGALHNMGTFDASPCSGAVPGSGGKVGRA